MVDDAVLIQRSPRHPETFATPYDRHAAAIGRFAARRLGEDAGEDVLAETFLTAFRRRDRYDAAWPNACPWLYGIAVRLTGHHRRDELRLLRALERSGLGRDPGGGFEQVDERPSTPSAQRTLARALAEAAVALSIPVGTVRSRPSRTRARSSAGR